MTDKGLLYLIFLDVVDVSPLIQAASSVVTHWRWSRRLLNSAWECPYRVVKVSRGRGLGC